MKTWLIIGICVAAYARFIYTSRIARLFDEMEPDKMHELLDDSAIDTLRKIQGMSERGKVKPFGGLFSIGDVSVGLEIAVMFLGTVLWPLALLYMFVEYNILYTMYVISKEK